MYHCTALPDSYCWGLPPRISASLEYLMDRVNPSISFSLSNEHLYVFAATMEASIGVVCLRFAGHHRTNIAILTLVMVILWYKVAWHFLGGAGCGCLGLLGRLLHVSKRQEVLIPYAALLSLMATIAPWLIRNGRRRRGPGSAPVLLLALSCLQPMRGVCAGPMVKIEGGIDSAHYHPVTGKMHTNDHVQASFTVVIADPEWSIAVTNLADAAWWEKVVWDGTNLYSFQPNKYYYAHDKNFEEATLVTISPTSVYGSLDQDALGMAPLWLTYGFLPEAAAANQAGAVALPLSWRGSRNYLGAYGYKWQLGNWVGHRFLEALEVVRDHSLDLDATHELLREQMDYPESLADYNDRNEALKHRGEIPDGFVEAAYQCLGWVRTNALTIPVNSEFRWYLPPVARYKNGSVAEFVGQNGTSASRDGISAVRQLGARPRWCARV